MGERLQAKTFDQYLAELGSHGAQVRRHGPSLEELWERNPCRTSHSGAGTPKPHAMISATPLVGGKVLLQFRACGDDGLLGRAAAYEVRSVPGHFPTPHLWPSATPLAHGDPSLPPAGQRESISAGPLPPGPHTLLLRARDAAGNGSAVGSVEVTLP